MFETMQSPDRGDLTAPRPFGRLVVVGAGAVGGTIAVAAARAGREVVLVESDDEHRQAIARDGLRFRDLDSTERVRLPVVAAPAEVDFSFGDAAIVAVKSNDTSAVCAALAAGADRSLPVFCAQNGVRNDAVAATHFDDVNGLVILFNAKRTVPGTVVQTLAGRNEVGAHAEGAGESAARMLATLSDCALPFVPTTELAVARWNKLLLNLANPIGALLDLPAHEVRNGAATRRLIVELYREGELTLRTAGLRYEESGADEVGFRDRLRQIADPERATPAPADPELFGYTSMWQDLDRRSGRSEINYLTGELVRVGAEVGVPTPANSAMLALARTATERRLGVGAYSISDITAAIENRAATAKGR